MQIKGRKVAVDWCTPKGVHKRGVERGEEQEKEDEEGGSGSDSDSDSDSSNDDEEAGSSEGSGDDSGDSDSESDAEKEEEKKEKSPAPDAPGCTVFLRNFPFDATRTTLFGLLKSFGHVKSIYIVKDRATGVSKGTAFATFSYKEAADRCLEAGKVAEDTPFARAKDAAFDANASNLGLVLEGRRVLVDAAVDKKTASDLKVERDEDGKAIKSVGKDRRFLYLKNEGNVKDWSSMTNLEQAKRQSAQQDKTTKLRSPLFFVNPMRLSFRNLSREVDEKTLKKTVVKALTEGLGKVRIAAPFL